MLIAGAIFHVNDRDSMIAFHSAVHMENVHESRFELHPVVRNVTEWDSFVTEKIGTEPKLNLSGSSSGHAVLSIHPCSV